MGRPKRSRRCALSREATGLPQTVDCPPIVALDVVGGTEIEVRQCVQDAITVSGGEREGVLGRRDALGIRANKGETGGLKEQDPPQPMPIVEGRGEGFGLTQRRQDTLPVGRWHERREQGKVQIDGLLACVTRLRQMRQGTERLLDISHSLTIGRPCYSLLPRLSAVHQGLVPHLAPQSMVGQPFDLLGHLVRSKCLQGCNNTGMQYPPPFLQEAAIGHLVGQGVLEGVCAFGKELRLIEKLSRLKVCEAAVQDVFR